ncbi:acetyltransferase [Ammoniphilus oxalaticus]|uniref:Acetyltransferase n=1 Tax=Ammoniphilus oxalaticus TaxID=66863 RepID=A0A419SGS3_9BACL|nr:MBOAT family protein [Ammoniphilus oxalaticus]RKD22994.1 acetyltransferase [Ammoniphilus oxalaticus]
MLFNSFEFIFIFLPIVFIIYFILNKRKLTELSKIWLILSSLVFYSWWNVAYLPLIIIPIVVNFSIGYAMNAKAQSGKRVLLIIGLLFNIGLLGYFKYYDFFADSLNLVFSTNLALKRLALPLAISFFTFQQIAYLVDLYRKETGSSRFLDYCLFISFFPQLIAGPIVHHKEIMTQYQSVRNKVLNYRNVSLGIFIFFIGLFKKVVVADTFAVWATEGFDHQTALTFVESWIAVLSYSFQLYFDFSGYSDMAIGAALLFNIKLPINFDSPYKSLNIQEFWRRWHITLGRFLTNYIYFPLGGSRKGKVRTYLNVMIIFLISGIWHGAGWTFVFWGFLHGLASVIYRYWNSFNLHMNKALAWFITFNFVNLSWVFFRANTWSDAVKMLEGMVGLNGFRPIIQAKGEREWSLLFNQGVNFDQLFVAEFLTIVIYLLIALVLVLAVNNSMQWTERFQPDWKRSALVVGIAFVLIYAAFSTQNVSEFLYFNF